MRADRANTLHQGSPHNIASGSPAEADMQSQQPDQQKNLILAIVLSMAVVFGWQYFYAGPKMKEEQDRLKRPADDADPDVTCKRDDLRRYLDSRSARWNRPCREQPLLLL